ncbi:FixH family protein [Flavobacteriales bacterium]|nr:FixH family protein [Flavobacteriales bacterium]
MNWGWKIAIFLTCFIGFIMYMVIYSFSTSNDLVAEDYYNQEILYQDNIDAQKNALPFKNGVTISSSSENVIIQFPANFDVKFTDGEISFYRPDNAKLDRKFNLKLTQENNQLLDKSKIAPGFYKVTIQFTTGEKHYLLNKEIWV